MDQEQRIAELERRLAAFESTAPAQRRRIPRRLGRLAVGLALVMAIVVPSAALAGALFTDVPNSHTFHDEIYNLYDARITAGCSATKYCPENTVTRGQMAGFLNRGLGRAGEAGYDDVLTDSQAALTTLVVKAGTVPGGYAQVKVDAMISAYLTNFTGCPCRAVFSIGASSGGGTTNTAVQFRGLIDGYDWQSASLSGVVTIPTGVNVTLTLYGLRGFGSGAISAYGTLTAITAPFESTGGAPVVLFDPAGSSLSDEPGG